MNASQLRAKIAEALAHMDTGRIHVGVAVLKAIPKPVRKAKAAPVAAEPMTRFCPACGLVGEVDPKHRDCCPDGAKARVIPKDLADHCHNLWSIAICASLAKNHGMVMAPRDPTDEQIEEGRLLIEREVRVCQGKVLPSSLAIATYRVMMQARPPEMQQDDAGGAAT